ncbi:MAG TPA: hypothetical protein VHC22_20810 [Pirellulales bacterium]|nr:hypothetical protein [Pirellulales bacterium]
MKRPAALIGTVTLLAAAIYLGRPGASRDAVASSPAACLERLFRAAQEGDFATYLDCFTGPQRERLEREADAQETTGGMGESLKESVRGLKGRAISGAASAAPDANAAALSVERIYAHHTERQSYHLVRQADGWRIDSVGAVEKRQPPIPYGSPVFDLTAGNE